VGEQNLWEKYPTVDAAVQSFPPELKALLSRHEAALECSQWLKTSYPKELLRDSAGKGVFHWDTVGHALAVRGRLHEALTIHRELYHTMCEAQKGHGWIHKGLPLVRLRDWHRSLHHPFHEERYLLLTLIEDAIREHGSITPEKGGIYHRFRWEDGRPDSEFQDLSCTAWREFNENEDLNSFPEEILGRMNPDCIKKAATCDEEDLYEINISYASELFSRASHRDWKALEKLAAYELSCVPGFVVEQQKRTKASVFDVLIRLKSSYLDFRRDLGTYLIGECKNWKTSVNSEVIAYLAQNLIFHECRAGILFSWKGITGADKLKYAALSVLRAYHHAGKIILVLDKSDFQRASQGEPLQEIMRKRYEEVRFDLGARRRPSKQSGSSRH
jgi:hypothetical protein